MPLIVKPSAFTCRGERLARAAASPHGLIVRPSGKTKGKRPSADSGEEVALIVSVEFIRFDLRNATAIHVAIRQLARRDQLAQPRARLGVVVVVVVHCGFRPLPRLNAAHRASAATARTRAAAK